MWHALQSSMGYCASHIIKSPRAEVVIHWETENDETLRLAVARRLWEQANISRHAWSDHVVLLTCRSAKFSVCATVGSIFTAL